MTDLELYRHQGNFHAHTNNSDGQPSPAKLAEIAYQNKHDFVPITDHNSANGHSELIRATDRIAEQRLHPIIPLLGNELLLTNARLPYKDHSLKEFEIIVAKPFDPRHNGNHTPHENFTKWCKDLNEHRHDWDFKRIVVSSIDEQGALVIVVHPGCTPIGGIPIAALEIIPEIIPIEYHPYISYEVVNGMARGPFVNSPERENQVAERTKRAGLTATYNSDAHMNWQNKTIGTNLWTPDQILTSESLIEAFQRNKTSIWHGDTRVAPVHQAQLLGAMAYSTLKSGIFTSTFNIARKTIGRKL